MTNDHFPKKQKENPKDEAISGTRHLGGEIVRNYDLRFTNDELSGNRKI